MPNLLQRLWNIFLGKANKAVDSLENPEEQLNRTIRQLSEETGRLHQAVVKAVADEKMLTGQIERNLKEAKEWERRAVLALSEKREDLAKEALLKKVELESRATDLRGSWETQKTATQKLRSTLEESRAQVEDAKRKYNLLAARYASAKAQQKITSTLLATSPNSASDAAHSLADKIQQLESETAAMLEIHEGNGGDLERQFRELEGQRTGDLLLAELKASLATRLKEIEPNPNDGKPLQLASQSTRKIR